MVSDDFHDFFLAAASAVGALIGLLFVAMSVVPRSVIAKAERRKEGFNAAAALSVFTDALVVSMVALIPGNNLGTGSTIVSIAGIVSTVVLAVARLRTEIPRSAWWEILRSTASLAMLLALYVVQLTSALSINGTEADVSQVRTHAILVIVMFIVGINRAWELVGASRPGVLSMFKHLPPDEPQQPGGGGYGGGYGYG
ncbi:hypothetical protein [Streptomyces sp. NPDC059883]|uniref:hypothetical protein n=1 Tax=unclassified Streptomyces TaxID=2593676 RepID=UPI003648904F